MLRVACRRCDVDPVTVVALVVVVVYVLITFGDRLLR